MLLPIAIDRIFGVRALKQMIEQGKDRFVCGFCVIVFPEGMRIALGVCGKYQTGGAAIAVYAGAPVVVVVHNAGEYWCCEAFFKYPGMVIVSIGYVIDSCGMKVEVLMC